MEGKMNVLIIGSGGREHALGWKISQSRLLERLFFAPGNPGTATIGTNLPVAADRFDLLKEKVIRHGIDLIVIGPENPLAGGIRDFFSDDPALRKVRMIGPSQSGARLESSKEFAKAFMNRHHIPTARYASFRRENYAAGLRFLASMHPPYVLKADGLAAGKGVLIAATPEEARQYFTEMLGGKFGKAGETVVIEEFLTGIELSVFILTDGQDYVLLPEAKDYKRIGEGDTGPNTGGMGAVSPVSFANPAFMQKVEKRIILPTLRGLQEENIEYTGFIFFGLMNCSGEPFVIEYNVRLGDPETEAIMPRIRSDFLNLLVAAADQNLKGKRLIFGRQAAATVMLVSEGYPGSYPRGLAITGLEETRDCHLFHAGTQSESGKLVTAGGRVLAITAAGSSHKEALAACYQNAGRISYEGKCFRSDIGFDL